MRLIRLLGLAGAVLLTGCAEDDLKKRVTCRAQAPGYDITKSSELQLLHAEAGVTDAVSVASGRVEGAEGVWSIGTVNVLVGVAANQMASLEDQELSVLVWDSESPMGRQPDYKLTQRMDTGRLQWVDGAVQVGDTPDIDKTCGTSMDRPCPESFQCATEGPSALFCVPKVRLAWWPFDFSPLIPANKGVVSSNYVIAVKWHGKTLLTGASSFNQDCRKNWSDIEGSFGVQGEDPKGCSWPMFQVNAQTLVEKVKCD